MIVNALKEMTDKTLSAGRTLRKIEISQRTTGLNIFVSIVALFGLTSCWTVPKNPRNDRRLLAQTIAAEPPGDYFVGRRYFNRAYHFWGYVRRPGEPWSRAVLVVLNEKQKLAPDRAQVNFGFDNNYEYKLRGRFSGDKVYELVSDAVYPEFVLTDYELITTNPPPIFPSQINHRQVNPFAIEKPL